MSRRHLASYAAVVAAVLLAFSPALSAGWQTHWDDDWNFLRNDAFRGLGGSHVRWAFTTFHHGPYQPLAWLSLSLDFVLWGTRPDGALDPSGFHRTNVLLHAVNAALALGVFRALLLRAGRTAATSLAGAAVGAAFFALHPLRVESVAWITERRDLVAGLFALLATGAYLRATERGGRWWLLAGAAFAASLLGKATGVMLPLAWILLDVSVLGRVRDVGAKRLVLEKLPFVGLSLAAGVVAVIGQSANDTLMADRGLVDRFAQSGWALAHYLKTTVLPVDLLPLYELDAAEAAPGGLWPGFLVGAGVTLAAWVGRRRAPVAAAAWAGFVLLVLPVLGLLQAGVQAAADRYTYLPHLALAAGVAVLGTRCAASRSAAVRWLPVVPLALLAALTYDQTRIWHDTETLWTATLERSPRHAEARIGLSHVLNDAGRPAEAEPHVRLYAEELRPGDARGWEQLGLVLARQGRVREAVPCWERALELDPGLDLVRRNLDEARRELGDR